MSGWIFAIGKQAEHVLSEVVSAGVKTLPLTGADGFYDVGDLIFVSEADGTEVEFMGAALELTSTHVVCSLPTRSSKNSSAKIWRPLSSLALPADQALPCNRSIVTGTTLERCLGGNHYAIQTAEPCITMELALKEMTPASRESLLEWMAGPVQMGAKPFTLVSPERRVQAVWLTPESYSELINTGGKQSVKFGVEVDSLSAYC